MKKSNKEVEAYRKQLQEYLNKRSTVVNESPQSSKATVERTVKKHSTSSPKSGEPTKTITVKLPSKTVIVSILLISGIAYFLGLLPNFSNPLGIDFMQSKEYNQYLKRTDRKTWDYLEKRK
jgi:hypoxanthine-guanine phosphoribosyltransferase